MKCPHCEKPIDGYRGNFSVDTIRTCLKLFYVEGDSIYKIVKHLSGSSVKTNKMTIKKLLDKYLLTWEDFMNRTKDSDNATIKIEE